MSIDNNYYVASVGLNMQNNAIYIIICTTNLQCIDFLGSKVCFAKYKKTKSRKRPGGELT